MIGIASGFCLCMYSAIDNGIPLVTLNESQLWHDSLYFNVEDETF